MNNGIKITAEWNDLNDGAAALVVEVVQGLIRAVRSGKMAINPGTDEAPAQPHDMRTL